jgi:hypothetical protein
MKQRINHLPVPVAPLAVREPAPQVAPPKQPVPKPAPKEERPKRPKPVGTDKAQPAIISSRPVND